MRMITCRTMATALLALPFCFAGSVQAQAVESMPRSGKTAAAKSGQLRPATASAEAQIPFLVVPSAEGPAAKNQAAALGAPALWQRPGSGSATARAVDGSVGPAVPAVPRLEKGAAAVQGPLSLSALREAGARNEARSSADAGPDVGALPSSGKTMSVESPSSVMLRPDQVRRTSEQERSGVMDLLLPPAPEPGSKNMLQSTGIPLFRPAPVPGGTPSGEAAASTSEDAPAPPVVRKSKGEGGTQGPQ